MLYFKYFLPFSAPGTRILLSPLEWGLGHASRCLPILNHLLNNLGTEVIVAANGPQAVLIKEAFPNLQIVSPPAYNINYHKNRAATLAKLVLSTPKFASIVRQEHNWLLEFTRNNPLDLIISDNRYGLHHPTIPSFFITHQLQAQTPFGKIGNRFLQQLFYWHINKFSACLVPDFAEPNQALAGKLSHPSKLPKTPVYYIGPLSRLSIPTYEQGDKPISVLAIISGPEPQRTVFEQVILEQWTKLQPWLRNPSAQLILIRGLPEQSNNFPAPPHATLINHLPANELSALIGKAATILCRSGYTSIMDLVPHHPNLWMVPTPGQPEQEYLAQHGASKGWFRTQPQPQFNLALLLTRPDLPDR